MEADMLSKLSAFLKGIISGKTEVVEQPAKQVQQDPMTGIIVAPQPQPATTAIPLVAEQNNNTWPFPKPEEKKAEAKPAKKKPAAMKAPAKKAPAKPKAEPSKKKEEPVKIAPIVIKAKVDPSSLEGKTKVELLALAKSKGIKVSPRMGKAALVKRIVGQ